LIRWPHAGRSPFEKHRAWAFVVWLLSCCIGSAPVSAEEVKYEKPAEWLLLAGGMACGLLLHESGHLAFDFAVGGGVLFSEVKLGPAPFVSVGPRRVGSPTQLYGAAMAGFLVEAAYTEIIFANYPDLVRHHQPFVEGLLALHVALDLGYAITGLANAGPPESDVNSMARAAHVPRSAIAGMLALPLLFDVLRYVKPNLRSRALWVGMGSRWMMFGTVLVL
jgi:hypothetical protein